MIIRNLKKEDIQQLAELQYIKEEYIDNNMETEKIPKEKRINDIINYLEKSINLEDVKIIVAMENEKILSTLRISFLNSNILISFLTNSTNNKANNELVKTVEELKKEKKIKGEISCISYYGLEENETLQENCFICDSITFRCKLKEDVIIEDNKYIKKISQSNLKSLPKYISNWIISEDIIDKDKIILLYEKEDIKEIIIAGKVNEKELQIFAKPRPDNKEIEKQLIRQMQKTGIDIGIRNFCSIEFDINRKKRGKRKTIVGFRI